MSEDIIKPDKLSPTSAMGARLELLAYILPWTQGCRVTREN